MSSAEMFVETCEYLTNSCEKILLEIAALTTKLLNDNQTQLRQIKWCDGESNTDTEFSELACKCAEEAWLLLVKRAYPNLTTITMNASIPDIHCKFSLNGKIIKVLKNKIELKSSKNHTMPGSTIGKLDINQPMIYCRRPNIANEHYEVRYGQYHNAMGESDLELFQDRTPRPPLNFTKLLPSSQMDKMEIIYSHKKKNEWIPHYGKCAVNRLKHNVSYSWQDTLTKSIIFEALQNIETIEDIYKLRESVRPN